MGGLSDNVGKIREVTRYGKIFQQDTEILI